MSLSNTTITPALYAWLQTTLAATKALKSTSSKDAPGLQALQTEASFRQFYRVTGASQPLVLMESPPDKEQNPQFVAVANAFTAHNICVPEILAHDEANGWLLLSDLGRTHFIDAYRDGKEALCLQSATKTLAQIAAVSDPAIPLYTSDRLSDELDIFIDWLVVDACKLALPATLFDPVRARLLHNAANQPQVCVHRDFHCKNLLLIESPERGGTNYDVGVLDFQDALIGPSGYDLASLVHDCYWKFPDAVITQVIERQTKQHPEITRRTIDLLAVQRQLKAIGIFARLASRDQKVSHLPYIDPVLNNLIDLCGRYAELNRLGEWLANELRQPARQWVDAKQVEPSTANT